MMRRTEGKAFYTQLRWIAGVPLTFALAVSTVLWWPRSVSVRDVKVEFVRFETSDDGGAVDYAVLNVRNGFSREWVLLGARDWLPLKVEMFRALGRLATTRSSECGSSVWKGMPPSWTGRIRSLIQIRDPGRTSIS